MVCSAAHKLRHLLHLTTGKEMVEHTISDVNAAHNNVVEKLNLSYKVLKDTIKKRRDNLLQDSEKIRSAKGTLQHSLSSFFALEKKRKAMCVQY
jgi:hypothetical protein